MAPVSVCSTLSILGRYAASTGAQIGFSNSPPERDFKVWEELWGIRKESHFNLNGFCDEANKVLSLGVGQVIPEGLSSKMMKEDI